MKIATAWSTESDAQQAALMAYQQLVGKLGGVPSFLVLHASAAYECEVLLRTLRAEAPETPLYGSTSCLGVLTEAGHHSLDGVGMGLFGVLDEEGSYGVGAAPLGDDPKAAAKAAATRALEQAEQPGALPDMVWITAAPGVEEQVIEGIEELFGEHVPIAGGSAADNAVAGDWKLFADDQLYDSAVVVAVMFPDCEVMFSFHSGYEPTAHKGVATRAEGRTLWEIDGRPAAEVYDEWTGGALSAQLRKPGNILADTTLFPLGRVVGLVGSVPYYRLSHPDSVLEGGGMTLFTEVQEGDELLLMTGTPDSLATRAGRVAQAALDTRRGDDIKPLGALVIYCAGCMLTIQERMNEVVQSLNDTLHGIPFLGAYTFGEQGCFVGGENRHGNLMISVLVFGQ